MSELESQIESIVAQNGYILYDIEIVRENDSRIFRVSITSPKGINHSDCQKISEIISPLLDVYNPIESEYFLEVSSPGLERILKNPRHFALSIGEKIAVNFKDKTKQSGILESADESGFVMDGKRVEYSEIRKAKTIFQWK